MKTTKKFWINGSYLNQSALFLGGVLLIILLIAAYSSHYIVQPEEQAVVKRFGKVIAIRDPGLYFKLPFGIDTVRIVPTARVLKEEFGFRSASSDGRRTLYEKSESQIEESLMLTGDLKVIDVEWVVQYRIVDPNKFLHVAKDPRKTLRDCSEAVMRRIVGNSLGSDVLTEKRVEVANTARKELQQLMDSFDIGLSILTIELQDVTPPDKVKPAFNEVNQAEQERERLINEAEKRRNQVIPRAEGEARQIIAEAEAYAAKRIAQARGETERFNAILAEFQLAPDVMRNRLLLESIEQSLPQNGKLVVLDPSSPSPLPFLNLDKNIQKTATQQNQSPLNQN